MSFGSVENYLGSGEVEYLVSGYNVWVKAYSASAINNGKVCALKMAVDTAAAPDCARWEIVATAEAAVATQTIGVVDNGILGRSNIAAGGYGFVCIQGQCEAYGGATVSANQFIEVLATEDEFKDAGVASSGDGPAVAVGVCIDALADGEKSTVFLLGRHTTCSAT